MSGNKGSGLLHLLRSLLPTRQTFLQQSVLATLGTMGYHSVCSSGQASACAADGRTGMHGTASVSRGHGGHEVPPLTPPAPPPIILHQDGSRLLFEIPRHTLSTDLLITCCGTSAVHDPDMRTYWHVTQVGNTVRLMPTDTIGFPILRFGPDSAPVVDVTTMLRSHAAHPTIRATSVSPHGITIDFTERVNQTVVVRHWRLMQLPNRPVPLGRDTVVRSLSAFESGIRHLEKRDPWADTSEVVHPIVYTLDPHIPPQWVPFVTRGLEEWNPSFEAIGFRHAIQVRALHGADRDAVWTSLNDGHHDVVVWSVDRQGLTASDDGNTGAETNVHPGNEGGEITDAPIVIGSFLVDTVAAQVIMSTAAAFDALLQRQPGLAPGWDANCPVDCPVPDSLRGLMLQTAIAHEMGHALGLGHNFVGRLAYPTDSLRSVSFVQRMGYTATVMDNTYRNYVAQPEDRMPPALLLNRVGPYDRWAIAWLYRPIQGAYTLAEERPTLAAWSAARDTTSYLQTSSDAELDQGLIGTDPVAAAEYHLRLFAKILTRFGSPDGRWPLVKWRETLKEAGTKRDFSQDATHVVPLVTFYLTHLVLGRDPMLQAAGVTWTAVPRGWDLDAWRTLQTHLLDAVFGPLPSLVDPTQAPPRTRADVCSVLTTVGSELHTMRLGVQDTVARAHADSMRVRLATLSAYGRCSNGDTPTNARAP